MWLWAALGGAALIWAGNRWDNRFAPNARYKPGSQAAVDLFAAAAVTAGLPVEWAADPSLHTLLDKESKGWVGIPNYFYGWRKTDPKQWPLVWEELRRGEYTARNKNGGAQTATGLGQLQTGDGNVDKYYPDKRAGIGDPMNEAIGMLRYIKDRYGNPSKALAFHKAHNWY